MNNKIKFLITTLILFSILGFTKLKSKRYQIEIFQDGAPVEIINNTVQLEKKEFQIKVKLKKQEGVFMSASFNKDYYGLKENEPIKDYKWLNQKTRAESHFNADKSLHIDDDIVSYLSYVKSLGWHRFDKDIIVKGKKVIGTKTINNFIVKDEGLEARIQDIKRPIYFFFVATDEWSDTVGEAPEELGRLKLKIEWK